ncbi:hypothetical protein [Bradyrhizobium sp. STM 3557]|uniref:hypothetical protein n=1 Tax=Bradyrhizobium sp. STM 3557 TaxID=578920 RepID=UPI00388F4833
MRPTLTSCLCVSLLIGSPSNGLVDAAAAAPAHHVHVRHRERVDVRPRPSDAVPPGWYKFPGYPPIPPEENRNLDPSNFGGG